MPLANCCCCSAARFSAGLIDTPVDDWAEGAGAEAPAGWLGCACAAASMEALSRGASRLLGRLSAMVAAACRARCGGWMLSAGRELYCGSTTTKFFAWASAAPAVGLGEAGTTLGGAVAARIGSTAALGVL